MPYAVPNCLATRGRAPCACGVCRWEQVIVVKGRIKDQLDYTQRDDEIVGTVSSFAKQNPTAKCALLTHDTGPMASAEAHQLPFKPIPDEWLLAPETTEQDKKIRKLEDEVRRLTQDAPSFDVACVDEHNTSIDQLNLSLRRYPPLTDGEIASLMSRLQERYPLATDFGAREAAERVSKTFPLSLE